MRSLKVLFLFALAAAIAVPAVAAASPEIGLILVQADVAKSCRWTGITDLHFGGYDPADANFAVPKDATSTLWIRCSNHVTAWIQLDQGGGAAAGSTCLNPLRRLGTDTTPTNYLRYDVYKDAARTQVWGCDGTNSQMITSMSSITPFTVTLYGRMPAGQEAAWDAAYFDVLHFTIIF